MKRFRFTLASILTLREQREEEARRRYGLARQALDAAVARCQAVEAQYEQWRIQTRQTREAGERAGSLEAGRRYGSLLDERRRHAETDRRAAQLKLGEAMEELTEAKREREALERLRGHRRREHERRSAAVEQRVIDDLAGRAATRVEALGLMERTEAI